MTHAEQLAAAKDALVEAACDWRDKWGASGVAAFAVPPDPQALQDAADSELFAEGNLVVAVDRYRALLAATCPQCGGAGRIGRWNTTPYMADPCPANCDNGRKRDE